MPSLNCRSCGANNGLTALMCSGCGKWMPLNALLGLGMLGLSWASFSIYSITLLEITFEVPIHQFNHTEIVQLEPKPEESDYEPPPTPETPPEVLVGTFIPVVRDNDDRAASLVIHLLTDDYRWMISRWDMLENLQPQVNFSSSMKRLMNNSVEIICIGGSSEEIEGGRSQEDGRRREEWRAEQRAESIARWVRSALSKPVNVRKLNIGHRDPALEQGQSFDTSDQRRVIIVLVLKMEEGANLDQALRNAFRQERNKQPVYETILTKYSLTQGLRFHWVE